MIAIGAATVITYLGNRYWTYQHRAKGNPVRELPIFLLLNGIAIAIGAVCLALSHYVLGLTSPLADNLSGNVIGLGLGTLFRFWSYRKFVFTGDSSVAPTEGAPYGRCSSISCTLRRMQNSLPSGSASTTQPRPSGSRRSSTSDGPELEQSRELVVAAPLGGTQIQVHPVLDLLGVRHLDEQQPGRPVGREDHALLVAGLVGVVGVLGVAEHLRPPDGLRIRVPGVDGDVAEITDHPVRIARDRGSARSS